MNNTQIITQYENKIQDLLNENFRLYKENIKLKSNSTKDTKKSTSKTKTYQSSSKSNKNNNTKSKNNTQHKDMATLKKEKAKNILIVEAEYKKNTPVAAIAEKINKSIPTVRYYIKELKEAQKIS